MYEQVNTIDAVASDLGKINSLLGFLEDYFVHANPSPLELLCRYDMYSDIRHVAHNLLDEQIKKLDEVSKILIEIERKGGAANE